MSAIAQACPIDPVAPETVVPPKVEYRLTELGLSLGEAFCGVWLWVEANRERIEASRARFDSSMGRG